MRALQVGKEGPSGWGRRDPPGGEYADMFTERELQGAVHGVRGVYRNWEDMRRSWRRRVEEFQYREPLGDHISPVTRTICIRFEKDHQVAVGRDRTGAGRPGWRCVRFCDGEAGAPDWDRGWGDGTGDASKSRERGSVVVLEGEGEKISQGAGLGDW